MKKLASIAIVLVMFVISIPQFSVLALSFDDFDYVIKDVQIDGQSVPQVTITAYTGDSKQVYIPTTIADTKVTAIGEQAFSNMDTIENIYLSNNVTTISSWAFSECDNLLTINVPNTVTSISDNAFDSLSDKFTMLVLDKSFAHNFAITNEINNKVIDNTSVFTVTFDGKAQNVTYGSPAIPPKSPTKKGHTFKNWSADYSSIISDINITSTWTKNKYSLSFNCNGGKKISDKTFLYDTKSSKLPISTKSGFTFAGWYTDKSLKNKLATVSKSQTVYAKWSPSFNVTFKDGSKTLKTQSVAKSKTVTEYTPTKSGYKFSGWYTNTSFKTKFNFNSAINKNTTVYAKWSKVTKAMTLEQISKSYINSCVKIYTYDANEKGIATGSGFMIKHGNSIQIVTNYHVIEGAYYVYAELENNDLYSLSTVYAYDKTNDVAVLTPDTTIKNAKPVILGDSSKVNIGSACVAIGSPVGLKNTVSTGLISQKRVNDKKTKLFQISTQITHGSSGGALFNVQGEVIGITTSGIDDASADINFAIYIDYLKNALKSPVNKRVPTVTGASSSSGSSGGDKQTEIEYTVWEGTEVPVPQEGDYYDYYLSDNGDIVTFFYKTFDVVRYAKYVEKCGFTLYEIDNSKSYTVYYYIKGTELISFFKLSNDTSCILGKYYGS